MRFSVWFKKWIRSFCKLMTFNYKKPRSASQRKREYVRRLKAKYSSANLYRTKRKYKKRRSSMSVQNEKLIGSLLGFIGVSLSVLLLPLRLLSLGRKKAKARKSTKARKASRSNGVVKKTSTKQKSKTTRFENLTFDDFVAAFIATAEHPDDKISVVFLCHTCHGSTPFQL